MSFSIIIPSRNAANLVPCVRAIREAGETARIIVVDDGIAWTRGPDPLHDALLDKFKRGMMVVDGHKPFVFARNINIGIRAAGEDDVILLNDDALLKTPGGFACLSIIGSARGIIAAACNNVGNPNQERHAPVGVGTLAPAGVWMLREEPRTVCFICVYIPRSTINAVGLLDERFVDYGMEDDDYCLRVRNAGLKLSIFDGCFVDHGSLTSSFRGGAQAGGDFTANMRRFIEKWGTDNWGKDRAHSQFAHLWPDRVRTGIAS